VFILVKTSSFPTFSVHGTFIVLLQHHTSIASILAFSAFGIVQVFVPHTLHAKLFISNFSVSRLNAVFGVKKFFFLLYACMACATLCTVSTTTFPVACDFTCIFVVTEIINIIDHIHEKRRN